MLAFFVSLCLSHIHREKCGVNIDGYVWDMTELSKDLGLMRIPEGDDTYYFRLCDVLQRSDLPSYGAFEDDMSIMMCNGRECDPVVSLQAFDWKFIYADEPDLGVIYHADGEPFQVNNVWTTFDIDVNIECEPTSQKPAYTVSMINMSNELSMRIGIKTTHGCPKKQNPPTPTPEWIPDCKIAKKFVSVVSMGVFMDFHAMNGGPGGIRSDVMAGSFQQVLFFQPCERMKCPWGYKCDTMEYSSVWLCRTDDKSCDSYGLIDAPGNLNASVYWEMPMDFDKAITTVTYNNTGNKRSAVLNITCNPFYEMDHFEFRPLVEVSPSNNELRMTALAADACATFSPTPIPAPEGMCILRALNDVLNLKDYNTVKSMGWSQKVTVNGDKSQVSTLYVQPCDGMPCPDGFDCEGDDHATVWLCSGDDCKAYGLLANNLTARVSTNPRGIRVNYKGDRKRQANIIYTYDKNANSTHPVLPTDVTLENTLILNIVVGTSHFHEKAGVSGGAIFLIIFFVGIFAYVLGTVLFHYWRHREWAAPHKEFWLEVAVCIKWGAVFIFTCNSNLGHPTEVKYDAI